MPLDLPKGKHKARGPGAPHGISEKQEELFEAYFMAIEQTGLPLHSARLVNLTNLMQWRDNKDFGEWFRQREQEAHAFYNETLEKEIHRRAVKGLRRGIYFEGERIAYKREYSDKLMELYIKKRDPKYRERSTELTVQSGGVLVVGSTASSIDEWKKEAADGRDKTVP